MALPIHFAEPFAAIVGQRKAEYACQVGKMFTGKEALEWGLLDELVPEEDFESAIEKEVKNWINLPIKGRAQTKMNFRHRTIDKFNQVRFPSDPSIPSDQDIFVKQMNDPAVQSVMEMYINSMKAKSSK